MRSESEQRDAEPLSSNLVDRLRDLWKRLEPGTDDVVLMTQISVVMAEAAAEIENLRDDLRRAIAQKDRCAGLTAGEWRAFFLQTQNQWQAAEAEVKRLKGAVETPAKP